MSKAERTREFIIEKTAPVFNKKGYAGTSLSDITDITGLTKGSIYGNFENKDEVALAAYEYNTGLLSERLDGALSHHQTATAKLKGLIGFYRNSWNIISEKGGCPILNAAVEADDNLPFMKEKVQKSITTWADKITSIIEFGKEHGEFRSDIDAEKYAYSIITIIEGGLMISKIMENHDFLFSALDRVAAIIPQELKR